MSAKSFKFSKIAISLALLFPSTPLIAQTLSCEITPIAAYIQTAREDATVREVYAVADHGDLTDDEANLYGNVVMTYGNSELASESFTLDRIKNIARSTGENVRYASLDTVLVGDEMTYDVDNEITDVENGHYFIRTVQQDIQGRAKHINHNELQQTTLLDDATYSTCLVDNEIWRFKSKDLELDHEGGRAKAKKTRFDIFGLPVLYTPYVSFPIDGKRHSGLLFPYVSINRNNGVSVALPYYFNIAPHMDALLAPGYISKRGATMHGEFGYLNRWQELTAKGDYLFKDKLYNDGKRWSIYLQQKSHFSDKLTGNVLFQQVSDEDYFKDLDDRSGLLSETSLERLAELIYRERNWTATLRFQQFHVVDRDIIKDDPYARLPQAIFTGNWQKYGLNFGLSAEAVRFHTKVTDRNPRRPQSANRLDITPMVSYRLENAWGFFEPQARLRFTSYDLSYRDRKYEPEKGTSFHRVLPIFSIDTGIFLEKDLNFKSLFGGGDFIQTLEPRLFYLYAPYREQSHIPIFDTTAVTPSYNSLFQHNAFNGADRQSNANQLTTALTTRFIRRDTGAEKFKLSAGQTQYFDNPRITRGRDLSEDAARVNRSEWFVEGETEILSRLYTNWTWRWSPKNKRTTRTTLDLRWQPRERRVINLGYRYTRNPNAKKPSIDQIDLSSFWQINPKWAVAGRYNYAINDSQMIDSHIGFEYSDCCVNTRFIARYYRKNANDREKQWRAYLEFEFNGIGNIGQDTEDVWDKSITGFRKKRR